MGPSPREERREGRSGAAAEVRVTTNGEGRVLLVDDEEVVLDGLGLILGGAGYVVGRARSGAEALDLLSRESYDLILTDLQMPGMHGRDLVITLVRECPETPVVVLTAHATVSQAVETMQLGAMDYLVKPIDPAELLIRIGRRLEDRAVREESVRLRRLISGSGFGGLFGRDPKLLEIFDIIERVAGTPSPVFIRGEPGTGKELIARAIHDRRIERLRERSEGPFDLDRYPFVGVNCGAFARQLLESQLFGHVKGSFTGAIADQNGVFVAADYGTLFLDEITELDTDLQVKLLRALQEREVTPIGSNRPVRINARIISATNRPVAELIRSGKFRDDLYYRINVVGIDVPPLRERRSDIPILCERFIQAISLSYEAAPKVLTREVLEAFQSYSWPGNVRELQNVIEGAFALGRHPGRIVAEDIPVEILRGGAAKRLAQQSERGGSAPATEGGFPTLDQLMAEHIREALERERGVIRRAASLLGIDRHRLTRLMARFGIELRTFRRRKPG